MFHEIKPGYHIKLEDVNAFNIYPDGDNYFSRKLNVVIRGKHFEFLYDNDYECVKAYKSLKQALAMLDSPSHIYHVLD